MADRTRQPNKLLRQARGRMSQGRLADLVSAEIYHATGKEALITAKAISDWECGWYTWPSADVRQALCRVLQKAEPADLGFYKRRVSTKQDSDPVSLLELITGPPSVAVRHPASSGRQVVRRCRSWCALLPGGAAGGGLVDGRSQGRRSEPT